MPTHHPGSYLADIETQGAAVNHPTHPRTDDWYEIRIQGQLDQRWTSWFDGMSLVSGSDGTTVLTGRVVDQAALHGLLSRLRDIGLPLLSVARRAPDPVQDDNAIRPTGPTTSSAVRPQGD
jgi:hypothetical protein